MANVIPQTPYNAKKTREAVAPVFNQDAQALREARIVKNKQNSERESQTSKDIAQVKLMAKALQEKIKTDAEDYLHLKNDLLKDAKISLKAEQDRYKIDQELDKVNLKSNLLKTQIALNKHYPNGIPQSIVDDLAALYSDVIKDPDQSSLWLTFVKDNNESITHFTKVEALRLKKSIDAAYDSVAKIESHIKAINADMKAQVATGYDPVNPLNLRGKPEDPKIVEQARKTYDSLSGLIRTDIKAASLLIKEFSSKIKPPISIESAALLNPFNGLCKVLETLNFKGENSPSGDFYKDAKSIVDNTGKVFDQINKDVNSSKIRGVDNPIFGANSWYEIVDKTDPKKRIYFNQKTGDTLWKSPNVISLDPDEDIPTIAIEPLVFNKVLDLLPPFSSSEGVPPMIYTGKRDVPIGDALITADSLKSLARESLSPASDEKQKHLIKIQELEKSVEEYEKGVSQIENRLKRFPPTTAASALGSREFLAAIQSLQTKDINGDVPLPNAKLLNKIITTLMGDPYGTALAEKINSINEAIRDFEKIKNDPKSDPKKIADEAVNTNHTIRFYIQSIEELYPNLPQDTLKNLKEKLQPTKDSAYRVGLEYERGEVNTLIADWKKYKSETKDSAEEIAKKAEDVNSSIRGHINNIEDLYKGLPENSVKNLKEKISKLPPVSQVAPQSGTSTTATTASNNTPTSISTDTDATSTASNVAMPSVSASTSSSATPTSVSTESTPMQGASEEKGETDHSIDEETGEKIHHPSWENILKINNASKSVASSASNGVADTASVDSAPVPLEADAAIAKANASTEVPTPLKSIPASEPASAIKIQENMDKEEEVSDDSTTDATKKPTAPVTSKKQSSK